jgi:3-deoxy-D-manno-octulosonic-acid transferase
MITLLHVLFYRWLLYPLMMLGMYVVSFFDPKVKKGLTARKKQNGIPPWLNLPKGTEPIWFHCSSGEFEYAKPLILLIKQRYPHIKILVTYFSPSVEKAAKNFASVDYAVPVPWDHPFSLNPFIEYHRPRLLAVSRTDTWPDLIYLCNKANVPSVLFSATLSPSSSKITNPLSRAYHRWIFSHMNKILCVAEEDRLNFSKMHLPIPVEVTGDTRYDQVFYRLQNAKPLRENLKPKPGEVIFVAGSTWPKDEEHLIKAFPQLNQYGIRSIIAPHEPGAEHIALLQSQLKRAGLNSALYTKAEDWKPGQILIIDCVGILAELYQWGHLAFVGNSFERHAIHSVMEPLAAGCLTFMGPYHQNNREAVSFHRVTAFQPPIAFAQTISSGTDLSDRCLNLLNHPDFKNLKEAIRREVKRRCGASLTVVSKLETYFMN